MNTADRYIDDVMRNVFATEEDRERLQADLRSHFAEAEAELFPAIEALEQAVGAGHSQTRQGLTQLERLYEQRAWERPRRSLQPSTPNVSSATRASGSASSPSSATQGCSCALSCRS